MLEPNQIYCGDVLDLIKKVGSNSVDLVVTSPPYNLGVKYDKYVDYLPWGEYYEWCEHWLAQVYRVLKPNGGRLCLNHYLSCGTAEHRSAPSMRLDARCCEGIGFKHHGAIVWWETHVTKYTAWGSWVSASAPYVNSPLETIDILYKERWKKDHAGVSTITSEEFIEACLGIWKFQPERVRNICPAPFPVELPRRCINLLTYRGELVLDPFNGTGATCVAAKRLDRRYIGFDMSEGYCNEAERRLSGVRGA